MGKVYRILVTGLLMTMLTACYQDPDMGYEVHSCAPMPVARASATCFVINDRAYVFAGRDSEGVLYNDLWCYTPATDSWESLGATPLKERVNATACVSDGKVYIGLGFNGLYGRDTCYLQDWWEYSPQTNQWTQLADYPNRYTDDATSFVGPGELYVGYGFYWNYRRDMFRYTIETNQWDSIDVHASFKGYPPRSFGGTGCTCQGRHFMGTGYFKSSLNWWAELVDGTHWEARAAVPGKARTLASSAANNDYVYLCGGVQYGSVTTTFDVLRDIRRYDPNTNSWQFLAVMPQGLYNHICFTIGNRFYYGLGENAEWAVNKQMYYIED